MTVSYQKSQQQWKEEKENSQIEDLFYLILSVCLWAWEAPNKTIQVHNVKPSLTLPWSPGITVCTEQGVQGAGDWGGSPDLDKAQLPALVISVVMLPFTGTWYMDGVKEVNKELSTTSNADRIRNLYMYIPNQISYLPRQNKQR